ncbi:pentatricopeptide repeat-containing protein At5g44230-like [Diospyros lotus]|uniref:pentatricopeptide repeat-containing protein At5g44230-like n=1 Tax=Diospyros lotus TaxID=55363 RepID=UPI0022593F78|nr:pentatricopeptide repeat-containing protein At5g44230-like [Diospyros lotus]XP_052196936.1 pentatricopeptide repeat-containing protein At5g44230-like [Diospyros lotus]
MVALSRTFCTIRPSTLIPKHLFRQEAPEPDRPFVPFSQLQQRKLLESRLVSVLHDCNDLHQIKQVHGRVIRKGLDQCCFVLTKFIRMLTKVGAPMDSYPRLAFEQVKQPNPFLWTALIRGYSLQGPLNESILLYNFMRRDGIVPVSFTFSALLKACTTALDIDMGRQIHAQTITIGGFASDLYVGNTMIDMYVKCGFLDCGRRVFDEMSERDVISWTPLIVAYAKQGDMDSAAGLFDGMPVKDMVAWTAMVSGFAQNARPREALNFFERMQGAGIETDEVTLVGVISACAQLGATKYANWVRDVAERSGFRPTSNVVVGSALIDMYSKCGIVEDAYKVFERMTERNVFSYSSMIVGFAMHGCANAAIQLFEEMVKTETKPNRVTFIGVLTACSHAGMVEYGRRLFTRMEKSYGITPSADHYACMVDLLGRAGRLEEALELIRSMPMDPHGGVWGALLGACRIHGNPDLAEIAAAHLFKLEPNGIGNYLLLSNIYAIAGRWDDVSKVRKLTRAKGLKKNPGCSWIEGNNGVIHEFFAGDMTHPKSREIKQALEDLVGRLKLHGYQPNLSCVPYDVNDEEKKQILMSHSEKLALAFGLLTTTAGCTIRIVKNLRICEDCHSLMCGASNITGRQIVVRDNMRFHHFHDGICSCRNFW